MKRPTQNRNFLENVRKSGTSLLETKFAWQPMTFCHLSILQFVWLWLRVSEKIIYY